ncbi:MAG: hypothetical protein COS88_02955 [Chloroflexi bacterium CG07_land_8_20_14_0_80_51_10]|nr:MAG: hypothetical protein COS88_02955 [Chloroflexi bacterium CG07_land_8_20_14_0_80_51_10]
MKRIILITLVLTLAITSTGCACIEEEIEARKPSVTITDITLSEISRAKTTVNVSVEIENPNPIGATLERIEYDIHFGQEGKWILLGHGQRGTLDIHANATTDFESTTIIENRQILRVLLEFMFGTEPSQMKVDGAAWLKVGPASFKIPFEKVTINPYKESK